VTNLMNYNISKERVIPCRIKILTIEATTSQYGSRCHNKNIGRSAVRKSDEK